MIVCTCAHARWVVQHNLLGNCFQQLCSHSTTQEVLQVYAPLGHALGMGAISATMEDICFRVRGI
jgi:(p)ppGpp synthase/HD superfamily hydrolase